MQVSQFIYKYRLGDDSVFLLNTLTGAADVVDNALAGALRPGSEVPEDLFEPDLAEELLKRGYLVQGEPERQRLVRWFERLEEQPRPMEFWVCPTFTCNLRCQYCFQDLEVRESDLSLTPEQLDNAFRAMEQVAVQRKANPVVVMLTGGEPMLARNKPVVEKIIAMAAEREWVVSAISNGTQLEQFRDTLERWRSVFHQVQITLDGPPEVHDQSRIRADGSGTFDVIARNISMVLELGVRVAVRVNVGPQNVPALSRLFQIFEERGWVNYPHFVCQLSPVTDHLNTGCTPNYQPEYKLLIQLYEMFPDWELVRERYRIVLGSDLERRTRLLRSLLYRGEIPDEQVPRGLTGCGAGSGRYLAFGSDGLLYPCPEVVGMEDFAVGRFHPEFVLDNAQWNKWLKNISNSRKCAGCNLAPLCGTACTWQGICSGSLDNFEPHCNYAQETIRTYLDLNKDRLLKLFA